jgi:hypothetical protein
MGDLPVIMPSIQAAHDYLSARPEEDGGEVVYVISDGQEEPQPPDDEPHDAKSLHW